MMTEAARPRSRGRPRIFDETTFLDKAVALFSGAGFAGVSMSDITAASGLTVGSVYKAYKDKEGVFACALERYIALREAQIKERLATLPDGRSKIAELLKIYVGLSQGKEGRLGCMVVAGVADFDLVGAAAGILQRQLIARRTQLAELLAEGRRDGTVGDIVDIEATAELLLALFQGMRVTGKAGLPTRDGEAFVAAALRLLG